MSIPKHSKFPQFSARRRQEYSKTKTSKSDAVRLHGAACGSLADTQKGKGSAKAAASCDAAFATFDKSAGMQLTHERRPDARIRRLAWMAGCLFYPAAREQQAYFKAALR